MAFGIQAAATLRGMFGAIARYDSLEERERGATLWLYGRRSSVEMFFPFRLWRARGRRQPKDAIRWSDNPLSEAILLGEFREERSAANGVQ